MNEELSLGAAQKLLFKFSQEEVASIERLSGGANNQTFKITTNSNSYLLKKYFDSKEIVNSRLEADYNFCNFAYSCGSNFVAKPFFKDEISGCAVYEFLNGQIVLGENVNSRVVKKAIEFIQVINAGKKRAVNINAAKESCFSLEQHFETLKSRISRIENSEDKNHPAFELFQNQVLVTYEKFKDWFFDKIKLEELVLAEEIKSEDRILSPSDFGFHNSIIVGDQIKFFDFEYAGWDDPGKLVCDFFNQPRIPVSMNHFNRFVNEIETIVNDRVGFKKRVRVLLPLYRLKWCCIMMNPFFNTGKERRKFSLGEDVKEIQNRQILELEKYINESSHIWSVL